jgi:hypothetical protein
LGGRDRRIEVRDQKHKTLFEKQAYSKRTGSSGSSWGPKFNSPVLLLPQTPPKQIKKNPQQITTSLIRVEYLFTVLCFLKINFTYNEMYVQVFLNFASFH